MLACWIGGGSDAAGAEPAKTPIPISQIKHDGPVDFEKEILPLLRKNCVACHNATKAEGSLVLETPASLLKGGDSGPAVVPHKPAESLLLGRATGADGDLMPPPDNKTGAVPLTPEQLGLIQLWISQGATGAVSAADPRELKWQPLPPGLRAIYALAVTPDGQYAAAARANQIFIYHLPSGRLLGRLTDPKLIASGLYTQPGAADLDMIQSLAISPDGALLASGGYQTIKLWSRPQNVEALVLPDLGGETVLAAAVSPDQKWLAVAGKDKTVRLWDLATGKPVGGPLAGHAGAVTAVAFAPDSKRLVTGSLDKTLRVWDAASGKPLGELPQPSAVRAAAWLADGGKLAAGGDDGVVRIWSVPAPAPAAATEAQPNEAKAAAAGDKPASETPPPVPPSPPPTPKPLHELRGHGKPVVALALVPSQPAWLVSGGEDGQAVHWDVGSGRSVRTFKHGGAVAAVAVRPDGERLATAGADKLLKLFNLKDGKQLAEQRGDVRAQREAAAIERRLTVARGEVGTEKTALADAEKALTAEAEAAKKAQEAIAPADKEVADKAAAAKKAAEEKSAAEKAVAEQAAAVKRAEADKASATQAAADAEARLAAAKKTAAEAQAAAKAQPDDQPLASARNAADKAVAEAEAQLKAARDAVAKADAALKALLGKSKGLDDALAAKTRAQADADKALAEAQTAKKAAETSRGHAEASRQRAEENLTRAKAALADAEARVKQLEADLAAAKDRGNKTEQPWRSVAFSADGLWLAAAGDDGLAHTYLADAAQPLEVYSLGSGPVAALAFLPGERLLAVGAARRGAAWSLMPQWTLRQQIGAVGSSDLVDRVTALAFSPDGKLLASGGGLPSRSGELKLWSVPDGKLVRDLADAHSDTVLAVEFSPDGRLLASGAADKFMKVFRVEDGSFVRAFEGHTHHVLGVSWLAHGRALVSAGADNVLKVWTVATGEQQRTITGFGKEVTAVRVVADTPTAVASSGDKTVRLYRVDNGQAVRTFAGGTDFMFAVAVTADGKTLLSGGQDGVLRVWNTDDAKLLRAFEPPAPAK